MATCKKKELLIGVAMLGAGLTYLVLTLKLPGHSGIDAAFVPTLLSVLLCLLASMQLFSAFSALEPTATDASTTDAAAPVIGSDIKTVIKTLALIVGYIALLNPVGFPIMTVIYLYVQFVVLTPVDHKVNHLTYALIALISSASIYLLFREAFDLMLPAGLLNF